MIREKILGPTAVFSTIVIGIAVITNYCYSQQRKFPNIVLVWSRYLIGIMSFLIINFIIQCGRYVVVHVYCCKMD